MQLFLNDMKKQHIFAEKCLYEDVGSLLKVAFNTIIPPLSRKLFTVLFRLAKQKKYCSKRLLHLSQNWRKKWESSGLTTLAKNRETWLLPQRTWGRLTGTTIKNKIMSLNFYIIFYRNLDYTNLRTYKYVFYEHPTKIEINESQFFHNTTISRGTKDHFRQVKVPGTTLYKKACHGHYSIVVGSTSTYAVSVYHYSNC
jgi:hypothetical protein